MKYESVSLESKVHRRIPTPLSGKYHHSMMLAPSRAHLHKSQTLAHQTAAPYCGSTEHPCNHPSRTTRPDEAVMFRTARSGLSHYSRAGEVPRARARTGRQVGSRRIGGLRNVAGPANGKCLIGDLSTNRNRSYRS
jgi:hypothetical protein